MEYDEQTRIKKSIRGTGLILIPLTIIMLILAKDMLFYVKNISNDIYFIRCFILISIFINEVTWLILAVKSMGEFACKDKKKTKSISGWNEEYLECSGIIPLCVFWISIVPIVLWSTMMIWRSRDRLGFIAICLSIVLILLPVTEIRFKRIHISLYTGHFINPMIVLLLLMGCSSALDIVQKKLPQESAYTTPIHISDLVTGAGKNELVTVEYHMLNNLASYTECSISSKEQDGYGYFIEYTIFQCNLEYLRDKVKNHSYELERYDRIDTGNWKVDSIFISPTFIVGWKEYYIEYEDKVITIKTNIDLGEDEIESLNRLLIDV